METNHSAVETKQHNRQVIDLTPEMEIPPERRGKIYDLTEALRQSDRISAAGGQPALQAQRAPEEKQLDGDADVPSAVSSSPDTAAKDLQTGPGDYQDPSLDTDWENLTAHPPTEPEVPLAESEAPLSNDQQTPTADIGRPLEDTLEETLFDAETLRPDAEPCDDDVELQLDPDEIESVQDVYAQLEPQPITPESDETGETGEQTLAADIGMPLEDNLEETLVDAETHRPDAEPCDADIDLQPEPDSEETVLERFIRTHYDADLDRIIDSVVANVVHNKISELMPSIS